ncbi:uncharacterized protein AB9W97_010456 isoform 1-T1 [Spinachia spinachia]
MDGERRGGTCGTTLGRSREEAGAGGIWHCQLGRGRTYMAQSCFTPRIVPGSGANGGRSPAVENGTGAPPGPVRCWSPPEAGKDWHLRESNLLVAACPSGEGSAQGPGGGPPLTAGCTELYLHRLCSLLDRAPWMHHLEHYNRCFRSPSFLRDAVERALLFSGWTLQEPCSSWPRPLQRVSTFPWSVSAPSPSVKTPPPAK